MHVLDTNLAMLFSILRNPKCDITENMTTESKRMFRKIALRIILSTDMAKHGEIVESFKKLAPNFNYESQEHREQLFTIVVKCADISTEVRPPKIAERWVDLLLEEFFSQSDREKLHRLPTMPFMDREKVTKSAAQIGFIGFVMIPLYETMALVVKGVERDFIDPIKKSLQYYKDMEASKNKGI
jgi:high affinity cGMP-specific 3',5'-cyclic phosphodiesterase 9